MSSYRALAHEHPGAFELLAFADNDVDPVATYFERLLWLFQKAGLSEEAARTFLSVADGFASGFLLYESRSLIHRQQDGEAHDEQRHEASHLADLHAREAFDAGFEVVIRGIEATFPEHAGDAGDLAELTELPSLTGDGVALRPWRAEDKPAAVAAMCDDEDVARWMPLMPHPYTVADGEEFPGRRRGAPKWREERWANFAAAHALTGDLVASCGLRIETQHARGEIGYLVHRDHRGQGVGGRVRRAALGLGPGRPRPGPPPRSAPTCATSPHGARPTSAGYRYEGVLRSAMTVGGERVDDALFALVPGDPRPWHADDPAGSGVACVATATAPAGLGWPRLTDGRLLARPFAPDDAPAVQAACDDSDVAHWIHGLPTPYSLAEPSPFIADARHRLLLGERARLAVTDAASGELLGSVGLDRFADRESAEIGYWVKREARRRGVALGAARLVVDWAFGSLGVERLELLTYPGNEASQARPARLGFRRECLLRGFLAPEQGKSRGGAGRAVRGRQRAAPRRSGAVRAPALRPGAALLRRAGRPEHKREAPDLAEPAPLSGLSPERLSLDPANRLDEKSLRAFT